VSCFTAIRFFLQATTLSKLEVEEKARKALEEDNERQVESIRAELAQLRAAAGTGRSGINPQSPDRIRAESRS